MNWKSKAVAVREEGLPNHCAAFRAKRANDDPNVFYPGRRSCWTISPMLSIPDNRRYRSKSLAAILSAMEIYRQLGFESLLLSSDVVEHYDAQENEDQNQGISTAVVGGTNVITGLSGVPLVSGVVCPSVVLASGHVVFTRMLLRHPYQVIVQAGLCGMTPCAICSQKALLLRSSGSPRPARYHQWVSPER